MLYINRYFFITSLFIIISLAGCVKYAPTNLVSEIENKVMKDSDSGNPKDKFNLGVVTLFDSDSKEMKFLARASEEKKETGVSAKFRIDDNALKDEEASKIKEISSISVLGLSGVDINQKVYDSCKYISIDNQAGSDLSQLICKINKGDQEEKTDHNLMAPKILDKQLVDNLSEISGIKNIGFAIFNDYKTGRAEFFLAKDNYITLDPKGKFPLHLTTDSKKITNLNTWTVITYWQNPCKICTVTNGKTECTYVKDDSCPQ